MADAAAAAAALADLRASIARTQQQIADLETAYFAHTPGVDDGPLPLGPLRAAGKGRALAVRREQRIFSLSSAAADGAPWPERAHAAAALAAALAVRKK